VTLGITLPGDVVRRATTALVAAALVAAGLVVAGPRASAAPTLGISGTVIDGTSGLPLDNVCITLGPPLRCWTATDASGRYLIDLSAIATPGLPWTMWFLRGGFDGLPRTITVNALEKLSPVLTRSAGVTSPPAVPPPKDLVQPAGASVAATYTVYLPNVTKSLGGSDGWHTPFIVQNIGTTSTALNVSFYRFTDGTFVAQRTATLLPGRSFVDSPRDEADLPGNSQFSVVVTSVGAPVVAVVNEHQGLDAGTEAFAYSGASEGSSVVFLPLFSNMVDGWLSTMIIQNMGASTTSVHARFVSLDGTKTATITRTIDPGRSRFIDPRIEPALESGVEYAVMLTSGEPIAVVSNHHHDLVPDQPMSGDSYNGVSAVSGTVYVPYIAKNTDGIGRTSRVVIQNTGTATAQPVLTYARLGGGAADVPTNAPGPILVPGGAYAFTPAVPDGEYSLSIGGGSFGVAVTTLSAETAMIYTGTSTPRSTLYMPNVTRTLSFTPGDPGWTTPILIQSATATSATLRWYRFSDGSLVTTQSLALMQGITTRVDPRTVGGLADNSQYAVVLESPGTVVAIVTEINVIGGDDAMIYKAFSAPVP
jgi:hypothetical protein